MSPSAVFTVMLALPFPTAVTTPLFTVATALLSVLHVTDLLSALDGDTVAVRVVVAPLLVSVAEVLFRLTELTETGFGVTGTGMFTVTLQVAVLPPSAVFTVMLAVPLPTAVITPLFTVATAPLSLAHVTTLFVALDGATVAVSCAV